MIESDKKPRPLEHLFQNNRDWVASITDKNPTFFAKLAAQQTPDYLWIGCADSRVPANELLGLLPGDVFVHRNIANVIVHSDLNCLSVLQFAIELLKVRHIIVCGHYGCSGVHAALTNRRIGLADNWLRHVQDVHQKHGRYMLDALGQGLDGSAGLNRLCELNAIEQASNVCQTTIVQEAWERGQELTVHSWIYGVHDGLLRDLDLTISGPDDLSGRIAGALARYETAQDTVS